MRSAFRWVLGNPTGSRFAALMRELTYRNNGTFVGLPSFEGNGDFTRR